MSLRIVVLQHEPETGQLLTGSFMDYVMPRAADLPMFAVRREISRAICGRTGSLTAVPSIGNPVV